MGPEQERLRIPKQSPVGMLVITFLVAAVIGMIAWSIWDAFVHPVEHGIDQLRR